jgi:hypothetical protein
MRRFVAVFVFCLVACLAALQAQNIQLHYDFGRNLYNDLGERPLFTTTVEKFQPDSWGSTYFFVDMDYASEGVASAYWEIARELKFWNNPFSVHVEYNGGLNYINHAFLGGATYTWNKEDFTRGFSLTAAYKYIHKNDKPHNFQLTGTWYINFCKDKFSFTGFADFWREKHNVVVGVDAEGNTLSKERNFIFISEPQFWVNLNKFKHVNEKFNLSVGTEWELSQNFAVRDGFYFIPTLALKWTLN